MTVCCPVHHLLLCPAGYWPSDFYKTNQAFGSTEDLKHLLKAYQTNGRHAVLLSCCIYSNYAYLPSYASPVLASRPLYCAHQGTRSTAAHSSALQQNIPLAPTMQAQTVTVLVSVSVLLLYCRHLRHV